MKTCRNSCFQFTCNTRKYHSIVYERESNKNLFRLKKTFLLSLLSCKDDQIFCKFPRIVRSQFFVFENIMIKYDLDNKLDLFKLKILNVIPRFDYYIALLLFVCCFHTEISSSLSSSFICSVIHLALTPINGSSDC